ncbi:MAG: tetronasin resistance protein, partial [Clostridiales bacterium]|nr:tetronasin resistance protein [Clostridiales bacterium]
VESNDLIKQIFAYSSVTIEESFTSTILMVMVALVTILPIAIINRFFFEEKNQYLSQIYGTKVKRGELYWTNILLAIILALIGVLCTAGGLGGVALSVMADSSMKMADFLAIGFNLYPSILFFIGLAALVLGWTPKLGKAIYIYLAYASMLNYFEGILDLPKLVLNTAPQSWLSQMPMEAFNIKTFFIVIIVSVILMFVGYFGYNRRDMLEGA